jgi:erythromycin esterase-like protein
MELMNTILAMKISKKIKKKIFIAVEGDWPDCYKLNRYIKKSGLRGICDRRSSFFQQVADLDVGQLGNSALAEWLRA